MTLTLDLTPEEEARLHQKAARQGQAPEAVVRAFVRAGLADEIAASEDAHAQLVQSLQEAGMLSELPTRSGRTTPFQPILVRGRPVSETLLEERR
jgi:plasmid stability protein